MFFSARLVIIKILVDDSIKYVQVYDKTISFIRLYMGINTLIYNI